MVWMSNARSVGRTQVVQRYDWHILLLLADPHGELVVGGACSTSRNSLTRRRMTALFDALRESAANQLDHRGLAHTPRAGDTDGDGPPLRLDNDLGDGVGHTGEI